ncbi:hypothetical protein ABFA07_006653 [Porites harrisoni]
MASRFVAVIFVLLVAIANYQEVNGFTAGAGNIGKRTERVQNTEVSRRLYRLCKEAEVVCAPLRKKEAVIPLTVE